MPVPHEIAIKLRRIAKRRKADTAERNRLIVEAHRSGATLRDIAAEAELSHVAVMKIIRGT